MMVKLKCSYCEKEIERYPSQIRKHNFCNRKCLADFSSKSRNPEGYADLKDYTGISRNMTAINLKMNPDRMTFDTKAKLSMVHRNTGEGKSYAKSFGRHTHRTVAERKLGRKLRPGEVVHHIDGNKRNNHPDNLMVFSNQAEHAKWHVVHDKGGGTE